MKNHRKNKIKVSRFNFDSDLIIIVFMLLILCAGVFRFTSGPDQQTVNTASDDEYNEYINEQACEFAFELYQYYEIRDCKDDAEYCQQLQLGLEDREEFIRGFCTEEDIELFEFMYE